MSTFVLHTSSTACQVWINDDNQCCIYDLIAFAIMGWTTKQACNGTQASLPDITDGQCRCTLRRDRSQPDTTEPSASLSSVDVSVRKHRVLIWLVFTQSSTANPASSVHCSILYSSSAAMSNCQHRSTNQRESLMIYVYWSASYWRVSISGAQKQGKVRYGAGQTHSNHFKLHANQKLSLKVAFLVVF